MKLKKIAENAIKEQRRNVKTVKITIPSERILQRINSTPALNRLSRLKLKVGENIENVNHYQFSEMRRMFPILGVEVEEVKS